MTKPMTCPACEEFFNRYRCSRYGYAGGRFADECDCPKCQGYCECPPEDDSNDDHSTTAEGDSR